MKRNIIITGSECSGKSFLERLITNGEQVIRIKGYRNKKVLRDVSRLLNPDTEYIVIDDVDQKTLSYLSELICIDKIIVDKQGEQRFTIPKPRVILTIPLHVLDAKEFEPSQMRRLVVINMDTMTIAQLMHFCKDQGIIINTSPGR